MKKVTVNLISESEFTVQGHGVHTAYLEMRHLLQDNPGIKLLVNQKPDSQADITHIHTFGFFALRRLLSKKGGKKIVSAHVVPDSLIGSLAGARLWVRVFKYYLRWFYNQADIVIAVSPYTKKALLRLGVTKPITVIPNSIDTNQYRNNQTEKIRCRQKVKLSKDKVVVVGNGQIQPRKRFDTFLDVAKTLPDIQFVWVGGIPFKAAGADFVKLNRLIKNVPTNVLVTGVIPLKQAQIYMKASDIMFMPSMQETFGLSIIEGAACGMPVIVRDIHDYDDTFGDYVIRSDEGHFGEIIRRLITDSNYYKSCQAKSRQLAAKYDSTQTAQALLELYYN